MKSCKLREREREKEGRSVHALGGNFYEVRLLLDAEVYLLGNRRCALKVDEGGLQ